MIWFRTPEPDPRSFVAIANFRDLPPPSGGESWKFATVGAIYRDPVPVFRTEPRQFTGLAVNFRSRPALVATGLRKISADVRVPEG